MNIQTKSDILAACIQADATLSAGAIQASAAMRAGYAAIFSGLFVLLAGLIAYRSVREQIKASQSEQVRQQQYEIKRQCFVLALEVLAVGMGTIIRFIDPRVRADDVLLDYNERAPALYGAHLVANLDTLEALLNCVLKIGVMHRTLIEHRPVSWDGASAANTSIVWAQRCTNELGIGLPSVAAAVGLMRKELGLPIDVDLYGKLMKCTFDQASSANEGLFARLLARSNGSTSVPQG